MNRKLLLLDTNAIFHRSRNALRSSTGELTTSFGQPVSGSYGVLNTLFSILENNDYDSVLPVYDAGGNFRKKESETYKANRIASDDSFKADFSLLLEELFFHLGFTPCGVYGYEADDIIASVARQAIGFSAVDILTCDRDLLACVSHRINVVLFNSAKKIRRCDPDAVLEIYGIHPTEIKYLKSLSGDGSDNVAGIPRIGDKTAAKIILDCRLNGASTDLTTADRICLHPKVRESAGIFLSNLRVISLVEDLDVKWFSNTPPDGDRVNAIFEQYEFNSYLKPARLLKIKKALRCPGFTPQDE